MLIIYNHNRNKYFLVIMLWQIPFNNCSSGWIKNKFSPGSVLGAVQTVFHFPSSAKALISFSRITPGKAFLQDFHSLVLISLHLFSFAFSKAIFWFPLPSWIRFVSSPFKIQSESILLFCSILCFFNFFFLYLLY